MPVLYLLCGLSFSGKSTLAREIAHARCCVVVSLDEINHERGVGFGGDGIAVEEWERTSEVAHQRLRELAVLGRDVVLDDTNCFRWLRDRWRERARPLGYSVRVVSLEVPVEELRRRREENARTSARRGIREEIFLEHVRTFEPPTPDEEPLVFRPPEAPADWVRRL